MTRFAWLAAAAAMLAIGACQEQKKESGNTGETQNAESELNQTLGDIKNCVDPELVIFDNMNGNAVLNGGRAPDFDTRTYTPPNDQGGTSIRSRRYCLIRIETYHWNGEKGATPGKIGLTDDNGKQVPPGPWQATGTPGQGGVPNANWTAVATAPAPGVVLIHGHYTVNDSSPGTWSGNAQSGRTFARVIVKAYNEGP